MTYSCNNPMEICHCEKPSIVSNFGARMCFKCGGYVRSKAVADVDLINTPPFATEVDGEE